MRDFQRARVYDWEEKFKEAKPLTREEGLEYIHRLCQDFGELPPHILLRKEGKTSRGTRDLLSFSLDWMAPAVLLHEFAHFLCHRWGVSDHHGPVFVGTFIGLLVCYEGGDEAYLLSTAEQAGLKVDLTRARF